MEILTLVSDVNIQTEPKYETNTNKFIIKDKRILQNLDTNLHFK